MALSILVPAYNEEATIYAILCKLEETSVRIRRAFDLSTEIVVINDGSGDKTEEEFFRFEKEHPEVTFQYKRQPNGGKCSAIRTALGVATGDIFIVHDADLEYDPDDFLVMLPHILSGEYQVVYGSRVLNRENKYLYRTFYLGARMVTSVANILYNLSLTDGYTCYKMFTREVSRKVKLAGSGFEFCAEFTAKASKAGYRILEVPIHYCSRSKEAGKKISWKDGIKGIWTLMKYRFAD